MAKTSTGARRRDSAPQRDDVPDQVVPDQVVSQVGKAAAQIMKLRQSFEANMATAESEEERQTLAGEIEQEAVRAIDDQGLTVDQYNQVIAATQEDADLEERVMVAVRIAA
jgi:Domain of unknown function (DUF4168)